MKIATISVTGLFGVFNHRINLRRRERITIIHGPNGVGKTTILRMLKALTAFQFYNLSRFYFHMFEIKFDDESALRVVRDAVDRSKPKLTFYYDSVGRAPRLVHAFEHIATESMDERKLAAMIGVPIAAIEDVIPELDQIGPRSWREIPTGEILDLDAVVNLYGNRLPHRGDSLARSQAPQLLQQILSQNQVYLIETQRLVAKTQQSQPYQVRWHRYSESQQRQPEEGSAVTEIASDLAARIGEALQVSARIATKLDAQFAYKLLTGAVEVKNEQQLRVKYSEYRDYNNRLAQAGIFESQYIHDLPSKILESGDKRALSLYLADVEEKLRPFGDLLKKVLLFISMINSRFKHKSVRVDKDRGLRFFTSSNDEIQGVDLSSGEQHELVLMYTLLFKVPAASLIAIDEPELSLHVTWQQKFLDDLRSMSQAADLDFIIATHSPSIVNGRLELTVELDS